MFPPGSSSLIPVVRQEHSPCCGGRVGGSRDRFEAGSPLGRPATLKFAPRRGANQIGIYYHPELASWVAYLGDPGSPIAEAHQPSSLAALRSLIVAIERAGVVFDDEWSPV